MSVPHYVKIDDGGIKAKESMLDNPLADFMRNALSPDYDFTLREQVEQIL